MMNSQTFITTDRLEKHKNTLSFLRKAAVFGHADGGGDFYTHPGTLEETLEALEQHIRDQNYGLIPISESTGLQRIPSDLVVALTKDLEMLIHPDKVSSRGYEYIMSKEGVEKERRDEHRPIQSHSVKILETLNLYLVYGMQSHLGTQIANTMYLLDDVTLETLGNTNPEAVLLIEGENSFRKKQFRIADLLNQNYDQMRLPNSGTLSHLTLEHLRKTIVGIQIPGYDKPNGFRAFPAITQIVLDTLFPELEKIATKNAE